MKISICMPYFNRKPQLINTIESIRKSELIKDVEFIIVDDVSNIEHDISVLPHIYKDINFNIIKIDGCDKNWMCPVIPHNISIAKSTGDIIIIQNPECFHLGDILLDIKNKIKENDYLVYGCFSLTKEDTNILYDKIKNNKNITDYNELLNMRSGRVWYQHSIYRPAGYNFCTAITRKDMLELGGFDERYYKGMAYGDDEFITRVRRKGMNIIQIDSPLVLHQYHERAAYVKLYTEMNHNLFHNITKNETTIKVKNSFIE